MPGLQEVYDRTIKAIVNDIKNPGGAGWMQTIARSAKLIPIMPQITNTSATGTGSGVSTSQPNFANPSTDPVVIAVRGGKGGYGCGSYIEFVLRGRYIGVLLRGDSCRCSLKVGDEVFDVDPTPFYYAQNTIGLGGYQSSNGHLYVACDEDGNWIEFEPGAKAVRLTVAAEQENSNNGSDYVPSALVCGGTISALSQTSNVATAECTGHGIPVGATITVAGATPSNYNGSFVVQSCPDADHFTYVVSGSPASATGTITYYLGTSSGGYALIKHANHVCKVGDYINVNNATSSSYNQTGTGGAQVAGVTTHSIMYSIGTNYNLADASSVGGWSKLSNVFFYGCAVPDDAGYKPMTPDDAVATGTMTASAKLVASAMSPGVNTVWIKWQNIDSAYRTFTLYAPDQSTVLYQSTIPAGGSDTWTAPGGRPLRGLYHKVDGHTTSFPTFITTGCPQGGG